MSSAACNSGRPRGAGATLSSAGRKTAITTPPLDLALSGGISILITIPLLFAGLGFDQDRLNERLLLASALVNWPHFMASFRLLYRSREQVREHRFVAVTFPALLVTAGIAVVVSSAWNTTPLELAALLTSAYLAWHYTGQAFGMVIAFGYVEGRPLQDAERRPIRLALRLLLAFHVSWLHYLLPPGAFPSWLGEAWQLGYRGMTWLMPLAVGLGALGLVRYARRIGALPPARVIVPLVAIYLWYALLAVEPGALVIVQLFHALQYLVFPLRVETNLYAAAAPRGVRRHVALYALALVGSGVVALYLLPALLQSAVLSIWNLAVPAAAAGVMVQIFVNVHHYLTDATVWKLSDPRVRGALFGHLA